MNQYLYYNRNYVLRKILNNQESANIIKDLIEAILEININEITVNPCEKENDKCLLYKEKGTGVVDVRIKKDNNEEYNIGIQFLDGIHIQYKMALYYLYVHARQIDYRNEIKLAKTITINFLDFLYDKTIEYHKKSILNKFKTIDFSKEGAEVHIIELPKFKISNSQKMTKQEQWISYLRGESRAIIREAKKENSNIQELDKKVQQYWEKEIFV